MSMKFTVTIASLFLVLASTVSAQDAETSGPELNSPVVFGPEAGFAQDSGPAIHPIPESIFANPGGIEVPPLDGVPVALPADACEFFEHVKYKNKRKIAPCAQTMVVSVLDPCSRKCDCETKCVQVKICVPTCGCPKVRVSRTGRHTRYDYGKYAVDIYSNRNGTILIDYDA